MTNAYEDIKNSIAYQLKELAFALHQLDTWHKERPKDAKCIEVLVELDERIAQVTEFAHRQI